MRVLHITSCLGDGGAQAAMTRLLCADSDNEHMIVSLKGEGKYGRILREKGFTVQALHIKKLFDLARASAELYRLIRRFKPDVIQAWMYHACLAAGFIGKALARVPTVWGLHNTALSKQDSKATTIMLVKTLGPVSHALSDRIVACAHAAETVHVAAGWPRGKMTVITNGYDLETFKMDSAARERSRRIYKTSPHCVLLGTVARFDPVKDHGTLLRSIATLSAEGAEVKCLLAGSGMDHSNTELRRMIEKTGVAENVILLGQCEDVPGLLNALDLHVLSSSAEAFPNALAEAMACGIPCVTTDVGDARAIVGDTGWLVPAQSPRELADAIQSAIGEMNTPAWETRRKAARNRVERKFSLSKMVERYNIVWRDSVVAT
jgi:glycosyltransferase involved in cell wall biosynthesis